MFPGVCKKGYPADKKKLIIKHFCQLVDGSIKQIKE